MHSFRHTFTLSHDISPYGFPIGIVTRHAFAQANTGSRFNGQAGCYLSPHLPCTLSPRAIVQGLEQVPYPIASYILERRGPTLDKLHLAHE